MPTNHKMQLCKSGNPVPRFTKLFQHEPSALELVCVLASGEKNASFLMILRWKNGHVPDSYRDWLCSHFPAFPT